MLLKVLTKLKIALKQNIIALVLVLLWFSGNFIFFFFSNGMDYLETIKILFFFKAGPGEYGYFYDSFTEFIIFGLVFSLITVELFRKYNPAATCREISGKMEDHVVIIGYSNIGKRLANYLQDQGEDVVIIEKRLELIEDLINYEEPVVHDSALSEKTLLDANVDKAKAVFIMIDNIEVLLVVNNFIRELNPNCLLINRVFEDDIADLLKRTYYAQAISTSKYASNIILKKVQQANCRNILLVGMNHISMRLLKKFEKYGLNYRLIEEDEEKIEEYGIVDSRIICGDPKENKILEQCEIEKVDCVIEVMPDVTNSVLIIRKIRDLNRKCKIIARIFQDHIADMMEKPPFNCEIISSSKATLEVMIEKGYTNF